MSEDERSYLQRLNDLGRKRTGRDLSDDEVAAEFALHGLARRAEILDTIEREELSGEISDDGAALRQAGRRMRTLQSLRDAHEKLRRIGR